MKQVFRFFAERHLLANILTVVVLLLGFSRLMTINRSEYPSVDLGTLAIKTYYLGASPEDVELNVTNPIEDELKGIAGLKPVRSFSMQDMSLIIVEIAANVKDPQSVKDEVREAVGRVTTLPQEVTEKPLIQDKRTAIAPIIEVGLTSDLPYRELREIARRFEKKIKSLSKVSGVQTFGYLDREIQIEVLPQKIREYQIPMHAVVAAIESRNVRATGGSLESYTGERDVVTLSQFDDPMEVGDVIVRSTFAGPQIKVSDLAEIKDGFAEPSVMTRINGKPSIAFIISKSETADIVETVAAVKEVAEAEEKRVNNKVEFLYTNDSSLPIINSFNIVRSNGIIGLILVLAVLAVFLNLRTSFWVAMGIPITMLGVIYLLPFFGLDLDRLTLTIMILIIGIIVDDAIIISENIYRRRELGDGPIEAAVNGLHEVFGPVMTTVGTTFLAFAPLFFVPGIMGKFIYVAPITVSLALLVSLIESTTVLPCHLVPGLKKVSVGANRKEHWFSSVRRVFARISIFWLKLRYLSIIVLFAGFMASLYYAVNYMDFILFPSKGSDLFFIRMELPHGTSLAANSDRVKSVESVLEEVAAGEVESYGVRIGLRTEQITDTQNEIYSTILVNLIPYDQRERDADQIVEALRARTDKLPGFKKIGYEIITGGPPVGAPVTLRVVSSDDKERKVLADSVAAHLSTIEGVKDIDRDDRAGKQQVQLKIDYNRLARLGLTVAGIAQNVRIAYDGQVVTSVRYGEEDVEFRVILKQSARSKLRDLPKLMIPNNQGRLIPLGDVVTLLAGPGPANFHHYDGTRAITITADVDQEKTTSIEVLESVRNRFDDLDSNFSDAQIVAGGEAQESEESMNELFVSFGFAILGIYLLLTLLFNSLAQPMLVLSAVPFGLAGVILAFALHGEPLGFLALTGVIGLTGVVVNDSLVLVNHLNNTRAARPQDDIVKIVGEGTADRLRPILLTTVSTVAGLLPLAYGIGGLDLHMAPMALALAYGLLFGTPITLIIVPCLYLIGTDIAGMFGKKRKTA